LTMLPVDQAALDAASVRPELDFEDALQIVVAVLAGVDAIVTRDETGFSQSPVPVVTPQGLVSQLNPTQD